MGTTFEKCGEDVYELLWPMLADHHKDLLETGVTFDLMFAYAAVNQDGERKGPALKLNGCACAGIVSIVNEKQRVSGRPDVEILIDGDRWPGWGERRRIGLLDHEVTHVVLTLDEEGAVKVQNCGRPKMTLRDHDWECGGFEEIAIRYNDDAMEVTEARNTYEKYGKLFAAVSMATV